MSEDLFDAIRASDGERVAALVEKEPSLAAARDSDGLSAVRAATYRQRPDMVAALLAARPHLDVFDAAAVGDTSRLSALLEKDRALAGAYSADGFTPLMLAAHFDRPAAVEILLAHGAVVGARATNAMKVQPLHAAVAGRSPASVRLLLAAGADAGAQQHGGFTPLQAAAAHGDDEIAGWLLEAGADPDVLNDGGDSAADLAARNGHGALAERLRMKHPTAS